MLATLKGPWVLAADFQCTPAQLEATGWLKMVEGKVVAPKMATCMGRTIDYFIVAEDLGGATVEAVAIGDALCKPHSPVRLYIRANPRAMVVRALKKMVTLEAKLPHGPAQKFVYGKEEIEGMKNDERYNLFISRMETEVASLMGKEGKELGALTGRTLGPAFVHRCALEEDIAGARRTSSVSRAWRRSVGWFSDLLRTAKVVEANVYRRKVVSYKHPPPDQYKATPQQLESFGNFQTWQKAITEGLLGNETWVRALRGMAVANAEKEERAAQQISIMKWVTWIREGPAHGLRRQHRFTRNAGGWSPTEKSTGKVTETDVRDELDELEGLGRQGINDLKVQQAAGHIPATAQQEADQQADMWHKQWDSDLKRDVLQWPEDMGEELPALLAEEIREAACTFPDETGLGWDRWHPKVVCGLSPELL